MSRCRRSRVHQLRPHVIDEGRVVTRSRTSSTEPTSHSVETVVLVTQFYHPEPVLNPQWTAGALRAAGFDVKVLTGVPNYPNGKVAPGYRLRPSNDRVDGISVRRVPLYPSHGLDPIGRMLNYVSWALSAVVFGLGTLRRSDVVLVYLTPATAALPALIAKLLLGRRYVLVVQDLWPDSIFAAGFLATGRIRRLVERAVNICLQPVYAHAHHVVAISPGMRKLLIERGVPEDRTSVIYNWSDERTFRPVPADAAFRDGLGLTSDDFVILYSGNHGAAQGLDVLIEAVALLPETARCHAVFIGSGVEKDALIRLAEDRAPERTHFLPAVSPDILPSIMAACDLQFVSLVDHPLFRVTVPGKVQAAMASGRPLLLSMAGDAADLVRGADAGFVAEPGSAEDLARAIVRARSRTSSDLQSMGANARQAYIGQMSSGRGGERLAEILRSERRSRRVPSGRDRSATGMSRSHTIA